MKFAHIIPGLGLVLASSVLAAPPAPVKTQAQTPPPYTPVRYNEDYSYLKNATATGDWFDRIKYISLGQPDWYVSLGGQVRERYEYFNNFNFNPAASANDDDGYFLTRLLVHADFHFGPNFRLFAQGKSSMEDGREGGPRAVDADEVDIQQLFVDGKFDLGGKSSALVRFGRQDLIYGAQRLISPLDWTNTRRTFEGLKTSLTFGKCNTDVFWVRPVNVEKEELNDGDGQSSFAGIYNTIGLPDLIKDGKSVLDVYGLALNRTNAFFASNAGGPGRDEDRYTIGARFNTTPKPWDLDVEGAYQFGQFGDQDVSAWMIAAEGGYTFDCPCVPRLYLGFDMASGNDNPDSGTFGTFNQLFPLGHAYFGYIDVIGRQNIIDLHPGVEITPIVNAKYAKKVSLRTDYHLFWRENENDAVYTVAAGGGASPPSAGVLRQAGGSDEMFVGSELDFLLTWQLDRHIQFQAGYSHFFAGDFIEDTGASEDIDFAYFIFTFTF